MITRPHHLIDQYLADDEEVIFNQAPDLRAWLMFQWPDFVVVLIVFVIIIWAWNVQVAMIGFIGELAILGSVMWRLVNKAYTRYVLTTSRAIRLSGVFRRDHEWISWKKITDVSVHRSIFDRWFGTATIKIQSANETSSFKAMVDVPNPIAFADTIVDYVNANGPPFPASGRGGGGYDIGLY